MLESSSDFQKQMLIQNCVDGEFRRRAQIEYLKMLLASESFDGLTEVAVQGSEKVDEHEL